MNKTLLICTIQFKAASWQVEDNNIDEQLNDSCINNMSISLIFQSLFIVINHSNNPKMALLNFLIESDRGMEMVVKRLKGDLYRRDS